jgi:hypothetical protein
VNKKQFDLQLARLMRDYKRAANDAAKQEVRRKYREEQKVILVLEYTVPEHIVRTHTRRVVPRKPIATQVTYPLPKGRGRSAHSIPSNVVRFPDINNRSNIRDTSDQESLAPVQAGRRVASPLRTARRSR